MDPPGVEVIYEDAVLLVVSKPQGMAAHPAPGSRTGTLVQELQEWYSRRGQPDRHLAIVSRLDKGTSGLVLVVTDPAAHLGLHHQVVRRQVRRDYVCLVWGRPLFEETTVDLPVGRHWEDTRRMAVYDVSQRETVRWGARPARTHLRVLRRFPEAALLSASLDTGRMHQIRVHCRYVRLPIVGDPIYRADGMDRAADSSLADSSPQAGFEQRYQLRWQCLHAGRLAFRHPLTGDSLDFESPIPSPFRDVLADLDHSPTR